MLLREAVFLGIPLKGPHSDHQQPFERFFANAKRSEGTRVPDPGLFFRHYRGKEDVTPLNKRVRTFHVEKGQTFSFFCDRLFDLLGDVKAAPEPMYPG